jgi:addiction module HigA family antidote
MIHKPLHPGVIIKDLLIDNTDLTISEAAIRLGVTRTTLSRLLNQHAGVSPEMALRLSKLLNTSIEMWINLQSQYDIWDVAHQSISSIENIVPLKKVA